MLKSIRTILTGEGEERLHHDGHNGSIAAHFVNGYIKRERKKKRKADSEKMEEDDSSSHSSNGQNDSTTLTYHLMYIPRILKNDLRRQYPSMFANVFNSCDYDFMMKFLHQFCHHSGRATMTDCYSKEDPTRTVTAEATGIDSCGRLWTFRMNDAPDLCFQLQTVQIKVRSDGSCTCVAKYKYTGTAIIYVDPNKITKILKTCNVNENGILVLPNLPSPGIFIKQTNGLMEAQSISSSSLTSNDEMLVQELNELYEIDQQLLNEFINGLQEKEGNNDRLTSFLDDESEYLFTVFTDLMHPERMTPRIPDLNETLPLGFPYEYIGDALFHLDDESKIFHFDMTSYLRTEQ